MQSAVTPAQSQAEPPAIVNPLRIGPPGVGTLYFAEITSVSGSYHAKAGTYLAGALAGAYFEDE